MKKVIVFLTIFIFTQGCKIDQNSFNVNFVTSNVIISNSDYKITWDYGKKESTSFRIQISEEKHLSKTKEFNTIIIDQAGLKQKKYEIPLGKLKDNVKYYWHVKEDSDNSDNAWSEPKELLIKSEVLKIEGLLIYLPFNGNANDESGNGYNGTVYGASLTIDRFGKDDKAYNFNGTNNYIEISNTSDLHLQNGFTICVWFKLASGNGDNSLISKHIYGLNSGFALNTFGEKARFYVDSGESNGLNTNESYKDNQWHFMTGTFDRTTKTQILYIDGVLKNNQTAKYLLTNNFNITVGNARTSNGNFSAFYKGLLDDIRIYNKVLSQSEIQSLYHEGGW